MWLENLMMSFLFFHFALVSVVLWSLSSELCVAWSHPAGRGYLIQWQPPHTHSFRNQNSFRTLKIVQK